MQKKGKEGGRIVDIWGHSLYYFLAKTLNISSTNELLEKTKTILFIFILRGIVFIKRKRDI